MLPPRPLTEKRQARIRTARPSIVTVVMVFHRLQQLFRVPGCVFLGLIALSVETLPEITFPMYQRNAYHRNPEVRGGPQCVAS